MKTFTREDWYRYYECMAGEPPRQTLIAAREGFGDFVGDAVDIGCGEGRDSAELLRRGWRVWAFDGEEEAIRRLLARTDVPEAAKARLTAQVARMETLTLLPCDLVNASFALPFCPPAAFPALWAKITAALRPGGRFAGQLFGERDTWASLPQLSIHRRADVDALLDGWVVERQIEDERDGETASGGAKHWHIWHLVARRP